MSGGSWNYLYAKDADEILGDVATMKAMRDRLVEHGIGGMILFDMNSLISHLESAHRLGDSDAMRAVWHEVEWKDSGDHSIDQLRHAAHAYNGCPKCTHPRCDDPTWVYTGWEEDDGRVAGKELRKYCLQCGATIVLERKKAR